MASSGRLGLFRRRPRSPQTFTVQSPGRQRGPWALTSSAARLDAGDREQAKRQRMLRQGWQSEAWNYRDLIGELRYAVGFLANCTARMRLYPACYPAMGEGDAPMPLTEVPGLPEEYLSTAAQAMQALGNGRMAISGLLHRISTNKTIAGEWYLLGRTDPQTGREEWSARSVDELVVYEDKWHLREIPGERQNGIIPWVTLDEKLTVISRVWTPHPRFELLADSPFKAMLDDCESLMILRRMIRATGRSRLAGAGLLFVPDEMQIKVPVNDDADPEADPFLSALTDAMMAPIADEGSAAAVVPIVIRGPGEQGKNIQHISFASSFDAQSSATRAELIGIAATSLDLPKEVILGVADLNHWSAWQVDDNTFRHHVEPHVIGCCDDLTGAYYRPYLTAAGVPDEWVQRMVLWYDPVELVTHPDRAKDAKDLYDRHALSAEALARVNGFSDEDMPAPEETVIRMLQQMRTPPPNLVMAAVHQMFPGLTIPPIETSGTVPGVKPSGVDPGQEAAPVPGQGQLPAQVDDAPPAADPPPQGPPPGQQPMPAPPITAAGGGDDPSTGVMVAFFLAPQLADQVALDGGEVPEQLHVTLAFLGDAADLQEADTLRTVIAGWAASTPPLAGEISGTGLFTAGPEPVTYLSLDLPGLPDARQRLIDALVAAGMPVSFTHGFTPHCTLAYADRIAEVQAGGDPVAFDSVALVIAQDRTDFPLTGNADAVVAAGVSGVRARRLSRKLAAIDAELRARLQTAANAAVLRQLERAGARLRTKVAKDETLRTRIARCANERVPAVLGRDVVTAAGLSAPELIGNDWSGLRSQFYEWTDAAQAQALATALRIGRLDDGSPAAERAAAALAAGRDSAWELLSGALTSLGHHLLYNPDPNAGAADWGDLNPNTLVPAGTIRAALAVAGGASPMTVSLDEHTGGVGLLEPVGQIGTGSTIGDLITGAGGRTEGYEWVHGPALNPFEPHQELDGVEFATFDDEQLANPGEFPANQYFMPGDHDGCSCDFMPIYLGPDEEE